jgi:hypothetical protein
MIWLKIKGGDELIQIKKLQINVLFRERFF